MELNCSNCSTKINSNNINVTTDLAKCEHCGSIERASELMLNAEVQLDLEPLSGSKIIVNQRINDKIEIIYPKKGFSIIQIPQLLFALFWLGFLSFWTWGASQASILFALFSVPFWLIGCSMLIGMINMVNEVQIITIDKFKIEIKKMRPILSKIIETNLIDIQGVKMKPFKLSTFSMLENIGDIGKIQNSFGMDLPAIISGYNTEYFFEEANDAEQEWITNILQNVIRKMKSKNGYSGVIT